MIARTFAFIYGRNQPNIGLLGIIITEEEFYTRAIDNADIEIDLCARAVTVDGQTFRFALDDMELKLIHNKGLSGAYRLFGKALFGKMCGGDTAAGDVPSLSAADKAMEW